VRIISATEASRRFSELLDAVGAGEFVVITRGGVPVAEIRPAARRTGKDLRAALEGIHPPDDEFVSDLNEALAVLVGEEQSPWDGE